MNKYISIAKPLMWFMAFVLATVVAGCGGSSSGGTAPSPSTAKSITAYSFVGLPGAAGTINEAAKTIAVTVPNGTNVTALVATFNTTGASVKVGTTAQTSGTTPNNFTSAVAYTVTAADASTAVYTVTVTVASATAKAMTAYSFAGYTGASGTINEVAKTIAVTVPNGTNVTALVATFTTTGASVKVGATVQTSAATANNFTSAVAYTVTAADASTAVYTVTVTVAASTAKAMTAYSFAGYNGASGTIDEAAKTVAVTVPNGTNVTALVATFNTTGVSVKVGATVQTSAATANNFTSPVAYTVTAADASTAVYTVTVTVASAGTGTVLPGTADIPTVKSANPSNGDINVPTSTRGDLHTNLVGVKLVTATFSEAMDPTTINSSPAGTLLTFTLKETIAGTNVPGTVAMNTANTKATFTPAAPSLNADTSYTATITTAAKNVGSVAMPNTVAWSFTTRAVSSAHQANPFVGQAPIDLLSAGNFAILAGSAITEADPVTGSITGDMGLSGNSGTFITVSCTEMKGGSKIHEDDAGQTDTCFVQSSTTVGQAILDVGTASVEAANRSVPDATELGAGDVSGLTIYPGLYKWATTGVNINTDVTLDGEGDSNAVWVFQISGDLTIAAGGTVPSGIKVILTNGAKASNIFWQVAAGSAGATLNDYATFNGNILSSAQVIMGTGAVLNGRAMASTQVTMIGNTVTQPAP